MSWESCLYGASAVSFLLLLKLLHIRHVRAKVRSRAILKAQVEKKTLQEGISEVDIPFLKPQLRMEILASSLRDLQRKIQNRELTCLQVSCAFAETGQRRGMELGAVAEERLANALEEAKSLDSELDAGRRPGHFSGIPFCVQFSVLPTQPNHHFSALFSSVDQASPVESAVVQSLIHLGAVLILSGAVPTAAPLARETTDLKGFGCKNPWAEDRTAGGAAGGVAALVSSRSSAFALVGDDCGGLQLAASFTGLCAMRPTSTRVSPVTRDSGYPGLRTGWGPITVRVDDLSLIMEVLCSAQVYKRDPSIPRCIWNPEIVSSRSRLRVGYIENDSFAPLPASAERAVREAFETLVSNGHEAVEVTVPKLQECLDLALKIALAAGIDREPFPQQRQVMHVCDQLPVSLRPVVSQYFQQKKRLFETHVAESLSAATVSGYAETVNQIDSLKERFSAAWKESQLDILIAPVPLPAFPRDVDLSRSRLMAWTMLFALIDFPVGTVPIRKISAAECSYTSPDKVEEALVRRALEGAEDLPIGVQVVGRPHQEEMCVRVMKELEWVHTLDVPPSVYK